MSSQVVGTIEVQDSDVFGVTLDGDKWFEVPKRFEPGMYLSDRVRTIDRPLTWFTSQGRVVYSDLPF